MVAATMVIHLMNDLLEPMWAEKPCSKSLLTRLIQVTGNRGPLD